MKHELKDLLVAILAIVFLVACVRAISFQISEWRARRRAVALGALEDELVVLCKEVARLSPVHLTTEVVPQRFPSKVAAQSFGDTWSLGDAASFTAKAVDSQNRDEDHPLFDATSVSGGLLYSYPALFFGMKEAHRDDEEWFLDFARSRNRWLRKYLAHLKNET